MATGGVESGQNLGCPPSHPHPDPRSRPGAFPAHACMRSRTARHYGLMHRGTILVSLSASRQHPRGVVRAGSSLSEQSRGSAAAAAPHPRDAHAAGATRRRGVQHHERRRRRRTEDGAAEQGDSSRALGSAEGSRSVSGPTIDAKLRGVLSGASTTTTTHRSGTTARGGLHACAAQRRARSAARGGGAARGATEKIAERGRRSPAAVRRASRGARGRGRRRGQKPLRPLRSVETA